MTNQFERYYHQYLNHNNKDTVVSSEQRKIPLNEHYYYYMIGTYIDNKPFISVHPKYLSSTKYSNDVDLEENMKRYHKSHPELTFRHFNRMTTSTINRTSSNIARAFDQSDLDEIVRKFSKIPTKKQLGKQNKYIESKNKFIVTDESKIVATALITDINFNGGNIAVYTDPNYRTKGYGKMVVEKCVQWCFKNEVVPIYLVDTSNTASIKLAESLGFTCQSEEFVLSIEL